MVRLLGAALVVGALAFSVLAGASGGNSRSAAADLPTDTPTGTDTPLATDTATPTGTDTPTPTATGTPTSTPTATGTPTNSPTPTATATPPPAPQCLGDVNGNGIVNSTDLLLIASHFAPPGSPAYNARYDMNANGAVNSTDLLLAAARFGTCRPAIIYVSNLVPSAPPVSGFGPYERDTSNGENQPGDGRPITINGAVYAKGLGVHADSDIRYSVPAGCTSFLAQVGIDDEVGPNGSVSFEVWDGTSTRLYQSPVKTGPDPASAVNVAISGVTTLRLVVTKGADDAFDHADWGDAKLSCDSSDVVPPQISGIGATPSSTSAAITWNTNEIADSQVEYGPTAGYGFWSALDPILVTNHTATINGLAPSTLYHYRVTSRDARGNVAVSADQTFTSGASTGLFGPPAAYGAGANTHSVTIVDINGDSKMDVVTANAGASTISVLLGDGAGAFGAATSFATGATPKSVVLGDLNGDSKLDAVTSNQDGSSVSVLLGNGNGAFGAKTDYPACANTHESALADLNGDNKLDIGCAGWGAAFAGVLLGNGDGTFQPMVSYAAGAAPHSIVARDFNGDGKIDLAVADYESASISVFIGNGNGTFQPRTAYASGNGPHSIRTADLNNDGKLDLVNVSDASDYASVYINNGDGTFAPQVTYATGTTPKGLAIADINGDGKLDIIAANIDNNYPSLVNPGGDSISVLLGNGNGTFQARTDYGVGQAPFAVAAGFLNGDGKLDIVTANWWDNGITVRLNTRP